MLTDQIYMKLKMKFYTGEFEMVGSMLIGKIEQKTNIRFRNIEDFETYIYAKDVDFDSEDVVFTGWLHHWKASI